jgi:hypothetical protein
MSPVIRLDSAVCACHLFTMHAAVIAACIAGKGMGLGVLDKPQPVCSAQYTSCPPRKHNLLYDALDCAFSNHSRTAQSTAVRLPNARGGP